MKKVLIVDDEAQMRNLIRIYLQSAGYSVEEAVDGMDALHAIDRSRPHVVILDIMMPGMDGFETCARIRDKDPEIPVLMLTARTSIEDKVSGLSQGADDYLTKPFDGRELVARVQALIRRAHLDETSELRFDNIGLVIDMTRRTVVAGTKHISLTPKEFELMLLLARHPGRTFSREEILERIWSNDYEGETRTVDSHVKNIREKLRDAGLEPSPVKTVWGIGYKFEVES
ncbi:response regulator transcription factor [Alicyclobacillus acidiphilus]|uniref:response regulator transcription factor n=1 Tax=Alicyclobacillus acidiphilus TaxID=182455 RepID=UPI000B316A23|nr:response regulator transcription factor [Alicyclobacillus acidiphilus]